MRKTLHRTARVALLAALWASCVSDAATFPATLIPGPPTPQVTANPNPGSNPGTTAVAAGNRTGQSFSLPANATVESFAFECDGVTSTGDVSIALYRAMDGKPWMLTPVVTGTATLPGGLADGTWFQIQLTAPLALRRGSYLLTIEGVGGTSLSLPITSNPVYPTGSGVRFLNNAWQPLVNPDADLVFAVKGTLSTPAPVPTGKPNIIYILADDFGWTDLKTGNSGPNTLQGNNYGSGYYQTPGLARLASEGVSFTHCFVQPNCAPTRAAMISGQYSARSGNGVYAVSGLNRGNGSPALIGPAQVEDVPANHVLWSEALQQAGYVTAHIGKYHLTGHGTGAETLPENQGFDFNLGGTSAGQPSSFLASNGKWGSSPGPSMDAFAAPYTQDYIDKFLKPYANRASRFPALFPNARANDPQTLLNTQKHLTDAQGDAAEAFINDHLKGSMAARPFFMQLHFFAVHTPIQGRPDLVTKYNAVPKVAGHKDPKYAALVEGMDQTIDRLLDFLDDPNRDGDSADSIAANTLVVFVSDNGGLTNLPGPTDNPPLRHSKGSFWNGGLRVPLIVRQPGKVPTGQQTDTLVHAVDFYPTLLEHAGVALPSGLRFDGESFAQHMKNPVANPRARGPIFYHFPGYLDERARPVDVVISRVDGRDYKLVYNYDTQYTGGPTNAEDVNEGLKVLTQPWELYAFNEDIGETKNLLNSSFSNQLLYGQIVQNMAAALNGWLNQPGDDWNATRLTVRATGASVPLPPAAVPAMVTTGAFRAISSVVPAGEDKITLTWASEAGFRYNVQASDGLDGEWSNLSTGIQATGATTTHTANDPGRAAKPRRFYRIQLVP